MTVDRPHPWHADLPELDDHGRRIVLNYLLDVLTYRDLKRDDLREAYGMATDPTQRAERTAEAIRELVDQAPPLTDDQDTPEASSADYHRPTGGRSDDPTSSNPWDWPDGFARRHVLGHQDEPNVPAYCTCGELTHRCPVNPRKWRNPYA